jgi:hypothetical protein
MILKASQRSGGKQLGLHLLKTEENEHVEVHEVSGFISDTVMGAMKEAHALALGTRCKQYLFSVSLNPPAGENVAVEVFEQAARMIEERNGLTGQPRIIVFHEKEGRRHAHCVWSRIDAESMTAKPLPFFKRELQSVARQLFIENGWKMPEGFDRSGLRDPRTFTLAEWQQAKRAGINPGQLKEAVQACWSQSDNNAAFAAALEERGLFLAKGDRRGHVAVTLDGEVFPISRLVGKRAKDVTARFGSPDALLTVEETIRHIAATTGPRLQTHIAEAKRISANVMRPLLESRDTMKTQHQSERRVLDDRQQTRFAAEQRDRAARVRKGLMGAWDFLTGQYAKVRKQNEMEAFFTLQRDSSQRQELVRDQMRERRELQLRIEQERRRQAGQVLSLYHDAAKYRRMLDGKVEQGRQSGRSPDRGLELG